MQQKFNQLMKENNIDFKELASKLNINNKTITRKINGSTDWTYEEIIILSELFNIKDPQSFFFDKK